MLGTSVRTTSHTLRLDQAAASRLAADWKSSPRHARPTALMAPADCPEITEKGEGPQASNSAIAHSAPAW